MVLSVKMCGMAVTIWSTCGFERKYVCGMAVQCNYGQLVVFFCGMAASKAQVCVVWLLQFGQLVVLSVNMCGMAVIIWSTFGFEPKYLWYGCSQLGQLVVLSVKMCGMAVTIWSTCGFERKYVWYGCYN